MSTNLSTGTELISSTLQYCIESVLGQGSFGITYKAKGFTIVKGALGKMKMELPQPIAIKEFFMRDINQRSEDGTITGMTQGSMAYNYALKFRKEAENLARMSHPNIVRVIDFIEANNTFYYVMEYVDGEDMNSYLKAHTMSEKEAISIILDVAKALKYMHEEQHMLHLDLKPGNIMRRKDDGHIYLIDFGLSKHYGDDGNPDTSTTVGLGTEGYAPLEQGKRAKDRNDFLPTIDVYALGATFFKLLTGKTPPAASDVLDDEDIIPDELTQAKISSDIIDIVVKAMKPGAKKRTASVHDFILALTHIVSDPIKISATSPVQSQEKSTQTIRGGIENPDRLQTPFTPTKINLPPSPENEEDTVVLAGNSLELAKEEEKKDTEANDIKKKINLLNHHEEDLKQEMAFQTFIVNGVCFDMVKIEAGTFIMGGTPEMENPWNDEKPTHQVTLTNNYYIGKNEVTQALWKAVLGNSPSKFKGENRPVERVSWNNCNEFISKLNSLTGLKFRLPTEAEWEFAARGGNKTQRYQYSGDNTLDDIAWYIENSNSSTHNVASKHPNELGIYDMCGNVWEWCSDYWNNYSKNTQTNPQGPAIGDERVCRGGSWSDFAKGCRSSCRNRFAADHKSNILGIRLALSE